MKTFTVYPKEGAKFNLSCARFEARENRFILYDRGNKESNEGLLCLTEVAAIIPDSQIENAPPFTGALICFLVYLKGKDEPAKVFAHSFKIEEGSAITFFRQAHDIASMKTSESPIEGIYISLSALIAILPSDDLPSGDSK